MTHNIPFYWHSHDNDLQLPRLAEIELPDEPTAKDLEDALVKFVREGNREAIEQDEREDEKPVEHWYHWDKFTLVSVIELSCFSDCCAVFGVPFKLVKQLGLENAGERKLEESNATV